MWTDASRPAGGGRAARALLAALGVLAAGVPAGAEGPPAPDDGPRYVLGPTAARAVERLLRPFAPGAPLADDRAVGPLDVRPDGASVPVTARDGSAAVVRLLHPTEAARGDRVLPVLALRVEGPPSAARDGAEEVAAAMACNAPPSFPWRERALPAPQPSVPMGPVDAALPREAPPARDWARPPPPEAEPRPWHVLPEPPLRRWARTLGLPGWAAVLGLLTALLLGLPAAARRLAGRAPPPAPPRARALGLAVAAVSVLAAAAVAAWAVPRLLPPPAPVRGPSPDDPAPPPSPDAAGLYAFGASTMAGEPYYGVPGFGIPGLVGWCLGGHLGAAPLHVQNLARGGNALVEGDTSRLDAVLDDPARFRPRVILVYLGHNEHAAWRNAHGVDPSSPEALAAEQAEVTARYEAAVRRLAERAAAAGATLVLALPTANLDTVPPQWSRHAPGTPPARAAAAEASCEAAAAALARGEPAPALAAADAAAGASPGYALGHFLRARALRALGRDADAVAAAHRARDLDALHNRASSALHGALRAACRDGLATCVDPEVALRARYGTLDERLFVDIHHPTARGYAVIAQAMADATAAALALPAPRRLDPERLPPAFDVSRLAPWIPLHSAAWWFEEVRVRGLDPVARRDALARVEAALDEAERAIPDTTAGRGEIALRRALLAAARGDGAAAAARLRQIPARHDSPWVTRALADPRNVELLRAVGAWPPPG